MMPLRQVLTMPMTSTSPMPWPCGAGGLPSDDGVAPPHQAKQVQQVQSRQPSHAQPPWPTTTAATTTTVATATLTTPSTTTATVTAAVTSTAATTAMTDLAASVVRSLMSSCHAQQPHGATSNITQSEMATTAQALPRGDRANLSGRVSSSGHVDDREVGGGDAAPPSELGGTPQQPPPRPRSRLAQHEQRSQPPPAERLPPPPPQHAASVTPENRRGAFGQGVRRFTERARRGSSRRSSIKWERASVDFSAAAAAAHLPPCASTLFRSAAAALACGRPLRLAEAFALLHRTERPSQMREASSFVSADGCEAIGPGTDDYRGRFLRDSNRNALGVGAHARSSGAPPTARNHAERHAKGKYRHGDGGSSSSGDDRSDGDGDKGAAAQVTKPPPTSQWTTKLLPNLPVRSSASPITFERGGTFYFF